MTQQHHHLIPLVKRPRRRLLVGGPGPVTATAGLRPRVQALAQAIGREQQPAAEWVADGGYVTPSGRMVFSIGPAGAPPLAVVRLTQRRSERLRHETDVLAALSALDLPAGFAALLPCRLAAGELGPWHYVVDAQLPGVPAVELSPAQWLPMERAAVEQITLLHQATAVPVVVGEAQARHWIDQPLTLLAQLLGPTRGLWRGRLVQLRADLRAGVLGRRVLTSWIHGDLWLGNVLVDEPSLAVVGLVDWDLATGGELPLQDVFSVLLSQWWRSDSRDLGSLVCRVLDGEPLPQHWHALLAASDWSIPDGDVELRVQLLLSWLRHVVTKGMDRHEQPSLAALGWDVRNVHRVLRRL
jgi:hypothetical protein